MVGDHGDVVTECEDRRERLPAPGPGFAWTDAPWGAVLRCTALQDVAPHAFTVRGLDVRHDMEHAWAALAQLLGLSADRLIRARQVHGRAVGILRPDVTVVQSGQLECDGLVTNASSVAVAVVAADCVPILIAHATTRFVAAAHAGWRGTASGIVQQVVRTGVREFGIDPAELIAAIGPSIGPCCYAVGDDVRRAFDTQVPTSGRRRQWFEASSDGSLHLDLWSANRDQLVEVGLEPKNIHLARLCTVTHAGLLHSHRAHGAEAGRMAAAIRPLSNSGRGSRHS